MKTIFKIFGVTIISILLLIGISAISVKVFEKKIANIALNQIEKQIHCPLELGDINLNLVRKFPLSTIVLNDLWIKAPNDIDTIAGIKKLFLSINSQEAINGKYDIQKIEIDGLEAFYNIDADTISNVDFLMDLFAVEAQDSTPALDTASLQLDLQEIILKNIMCSYFDSTTNIGAKIHIPKIEVKGNINDEDYDIESDGKVIISDVYFADFNLHLMQEATMEFDIEYYGDSVSINDFKIQSDGLLVKASGNTLMEDLKVNALIKEANFDLGILSQYLSASVKKEMGINSAEGQLSFESTITGQYNDSIMPYVESTFNIQNVKLSTTEYPEIKYLSTAGTINNGSAHTTESTTLVIDHFEVNTPQSNLNLSGTVCNLDLPRYNINSSGMVTISEFLDFIPDSLVESISGKIKWTLTTKGKVPAVIDDSFSDQVLANSKLNITLENFSTKMDSLVHLENCNTVMSYAQHKVTVDQFSTILPYYDMEIKDLTSIVSFKGSVTDIDNMAVNISQFDMAFDNQQMSLSAELSNLYAPQYNMNASASLDLAGLQKFAPDTLLKSMSGLAKCDITSQGYIHLDSIETQITDLAFNNSTINITTDQVNVAMVDTLIEVENFDLNFSLKSGVINIPHLSGRYKTMDFGLDSTIVSNAYATLVMNEAEKLSIYTKMKFGDIDYDLFVPFMIEEEDLPTDSSEATEPYVQNFTFCVKGDLAINSLFIDNYEVDSTMTVNNIDIENMSSLFKLCDTSYIIDQMQFNGLGGYLNTSFRYDIYPEKTVIAMKNHIDGMDFKKLLSNMDNFGQTDITSENISGQLLSDFYAELTMVGDSIVQHSLKASGDFTLSNGGVYDFEPAEELSKFTGMKELDNIQFQTLKTNLFVLKGAAYIPKTEIVNTAVDITLLGKQPFEDDFEYYLELNMGDILTGKRNRLMERQEKAASKEDKNVKRNGVNLVALSKEEKTKIKFDNKKQREQMIRVIRLQKNALGLKFHPSLFDFNTK